MNRDLMLVLVRLPLALGVIIALPFSNAQWGEPHPDGGPHAFGIFITFIIIGMVAGMLFVSLGTLGQVLLRKRPARLTLFTDLGLFIFFSAVLVYGGVTAKYHDSQPNRRVEANQSPTSG